LLEWKIALVSLKSLFENSKSIFPRPVPQFPAPISCHIISSYHHLPSLPPFPCHPLPSPAIPHLIQPYVTHDTSRRGQNGQNGTADTPRHPTNMQRAENNLKRSKTRRTGRQKGWGRGRGAREGKRAGRKGKPTFFFIFYYFTYPTKQNPFPLRQTPKRACSAPTTTPSARIST